MVSLSFSCVSTCLFLAYLIFASRTFYYILSPWSVLDPTESIFFAPAWPKGQPLWASEECVFDVSTLSTTEVGATLNISKKEFPEIVKRLENNNEVFAHFVLVAPGKSDVWTMTSMVKRLDKIIPKTVRYLVRDWPVLGQYVPPDVEVIEGQAASPGDQVGYWKPQIGLHIVEDWTQWPVKSTPRAVVLGLQIRGKKYLPVVSTEQLGLTRDSMIQINSTMSADYITKDTGSTIRYDGGILPLTISINSMSVARWQFGAHMSRAIEDQKAFGASTKDTDEMRSLITETSPVLLATTFVVSLLHAFIDFLAFKSDVSFWRATKTTAGLSVSSVVISLFNEVVIFFYLQDTGASLLLLVPCAIGIVIQMWKVFRVYRLSAGDTASQKEQAETKSFDQKATKWMLQLLLPMVLAYSVYSLIYEKHSGFYSWTISSLATSVYAFGFALMTPQLFINYKLKSVAHLPWQFLVYRAINTFIDDLFAFIITMPTMHRAACFRDDIVFVVYMYQRWIYPVDQSRPQDGVKDKTE